VVPAAIPTSGLWVVQAAQAAQAETRTFDPWAAQVVQVVLAVQAWVVQEAILTFGPWVVQAVLVALVVQVLAETLTSVQVVQAVQVAQVVLVVLVLVECHRVEILTLVQEALVREETQEIYLATHCNSKARASEQISEETTATQQICMCSATTRN